MAAMITDTPIKKKTLSKYSHKAKYILHVAPIQRSGTVHRAFLALALIQAAPYQMLSAGRRAQQLKNRCIVK